MNYTEEMSDEISVILNQFKNDEISEAQCKSQILDVIENAN